MNIDASTVAIVTGASSGIGWETALAFSARGARVIAAARSKDKLDELARLSKKGPIEAIATDVSNETSCQALVDETVRRHGRIDVLVNNAGFGHYAGVEHLETEDLERIFRTNLFGSLWCAKAAIPRMRAQGGGHIVNVSTIIAQRSVPFMSAYCMSKFALNALDESLALEVGRDGIGVSLVCPGLTHTGFQTNARKIGFSPPVSNASGMRAERVAQAILSAVERRRRRTYLTASGRALVWAQRISPRFVDAVLDLMYAKKRIERTN